MKKEFSDLINKVFNKSREAGYLQLVTEDEVLDGKHITANGNKKPVVGFIAGQTAPPGRRMGHAGAIIGGADDTAAAKMRIMRENGILVAESPAEIGATMAKALGVTA